MIFQNTSNSILKKQNDLFLLKCQIAQRSEYSEAKKILKIKTLSTCFFVILSIFATILNLDWLSAVASLFAVALIITNKYVESRVITHKKHAASIQQYIDASLYSCAIGGEKSEWGNMPNQTDLVTSISKFSRADVSEVKNWYSDYSSLLPNQQIFHCQRENVRWDYELQKKFKLFQFATAIVVLLITLFVFLIFNPTFIKMICVLSWFVPVAEYFYSIYKQVDENIKLFHKIDKHCNDIESKLSIANNSEIKNLLIELQYEIWNRRETGVLIPDWFYKLNLKKQQEDEDGIAGTIKTLI